MAAAACESLWAALQAGGAGALVARCRAAAAAGLPMRLVLLLSRLMRRQLSGASLKYLVTEANLFFHPHQGSPAT